MDKIPILDEQNLDSTNTPLKKWQILLSSIFILLILSFGGALLNGLSMFISPDYYGPTFPTFPNSEVWGLRIPSQNQVVQAIGTGIGHGLGVGIFYVLVFIPLFLKFNVTTKQLKKLLQETFMLIFFFWVLGGILGLVQLYFYPASQEQIILQGITSGFPRYVDYRLEWTIYSIRVSMGGFLFAFILQLIKIFGGNWTSSHAS